MIGLLSMGFVQPPQLNIPFEAMTRSRRYVTVLALRIAVVRGYTVGPPRGTTTPPDSVTHSMSSLMIS